MDRDALMGAPAPDFGDLGLADLVDADVCVLPGVRDVGTAGDFPLPGLVDQAIANLELQGPIRALVS